LSVIRGSEINFLSALSLVAVDDGVCVFPLSVDILDNIGARTIRLVLLVVLGSFDVVMHGVFHVAIDFLGRAFHLINDAFIGELLIADRFANSLLDLSFDLIELSTYLFGIHEYILPVDTTVNNRAAAKHGAPAVSDYWPSTANQLDKQHDQGEHQQNVDVGSYCVKTHQPHQPQHEQDNKNCPEHLPSPWACLHRYTVVGCPCSFEGCNPLPEKSGVS
jgi:hypothetical protein